MTDGVHLGPFELRDHLGEGGMGVVYRARHRDTDRSVAIKVLHPPEGASSRGLRGFQREIRTLAKLHHPAIAAIADFGPIPAAAARNGPESLVEGTPWFAMEFVDGRPMNRVARSWSWAKLSDVLRTILDGLAHAHARSVVHRDLKPSNILVREGADSDPRAKLVDFGLARLFEGDDWNSSAEDDTDSVSGTPQYMAPEHIYGEWRDQGPWTDLYALGCMTWRIVCDRAPFDGETTDDTLRKHVLEPLPPFEPRIPVPEGLEGWLRGLLQKEPERRIRRAADAAWRLSQLSDPVEEDSPTPESPDAPGEALPTLRELHDTYLDTVESRKATVRDTAVDPGAPPRPSDLSREAGMNDPPDWFDEVPPVVDDWRRGGPPRSTSPVPKAGLNLFGLREIPVVDRDDERDRIWSRLRAAADDEGPELVTIEAGPGAGKTRLGRWLLHRAHELGAATTLRAVHTSEGAPDQGLRDMVRRAFRTEGLERSDVFEHLAERLPVLEGDESRLVDARALTELLRPTDDEANTVDGPRYQFSSPNQKYALFGRLFARMALRRPVAVWFDDLQWGDESIGVLRQLFATEDVSAPVTAVATVRSDIVAEDAERSERLEELYERADATRIRLAPLATDDHRRLVERLLDLEPELAEAVAERTEGNPLFAIQLLRHWVDRDLLVAGEQGFRLDRHGDLEVPAGIHELWLERVDRLIADVAADSREEMERLLEAAAALGREVDHDEWRTLCELIDIDGAGATRDALVRRGLAEDTETGWAFVHGMLVDSLAERAKRRGRWRDHHRLCARVLERAYPDRPTQTARRRANHWQTADEPVEALDPLLEETERLRETGNAGPRREVLDRRAQLIDGLDLPQGDPRRIENAVELGACQLQLGLPPEEIGRSLESARKQAKKSGDHRLLAKAYGISARCRRAVGEPERAEEFARRAVEHARETDDTAMLAEMLVESGWTAYLSGELDRAEECYEEAIDRAEASEARYFEAVAHLGMAWIVQLRGESLRAGELLERLLEESREVGYRALEAECWNGLGEIARFQGDAERARTCYRKHRDISSELDRPEFVAVSELNLALVDLMTGRYDAARDGLEAIARHEESSEKSEREHLIRTAKLTRAAGLGDWSSVDERFEAYADGWPDDARLLKDHPWLLEIAGDCAAEADETDRARRLWSLAATLWRRLDNARRADRVEEKLETD